MKKILSFAIMAVMAFSLVSMNAVEASAATVSAKPKKEYKTVIFDAHLHCADCVKKVKENISFEKGVKGLDISLENHSITIKYDDSKTDPAKLEAAIEKLGYEAEIRTEKAAKAENTQSETK